MENITNLLGDYSFSNIEDRMEFDLNGVVEKESKKVYLAENLKFCVSCIDYTTLRESDTLGSVTFFVEDLLKKLKKEDLRNVASVCVFPNFAPIVRQALSGHDIKTTVVAGGFPASQTFIELKLSECKMAIEAGAEEIDVVLSVGDILEKNYQKVYNELSAIRSVCKNVRLKVILETGELKSIENIFNASLIAMYAGADFIKTSTGKVPVNATPEAVYIMCNAIKQFKEKTGKTVGIKVAGGVAKAHNALRYLVIVNYVLGERWVSSDYFRIGSSKLLEDIIKELKNTKE
ncbi:deoxyribose-phosphate aldolase [Porphyromonadaceae bacterium OttesenSCG-928-L07]|nr:deoxyribose-phosphate aldolase [Porphyromonadaceae bacterium OttesenSCG-928-L07]MDL2330788.1 deoxyribose-phosphate aldolase [Odoribacter sp. OttesenSCG-928-A06]